MHVAIMFYVDHVCMLRLYASYFMLIIYACYDYVLCWSCMHVAIIFYADHAC